MFESDHGAEVVAAGLAGRSAANLRDKCLGVVEVEVAGAGGVGEAAGRHAQEHGFADPPRYLVAIDRRGVSGVDNWLQLDITVGVAKKAADLPEGKWSYSFEPGDAAAEQAR